MRQPIALELLADELELRCALGSDPAAPRPLPRFAHERTDLLKPAIVEVPGDELFVRTLDEKT
ncbi:hypothetical protein D3C73_1596250 [compost metagenome]